jgi:HNH endonuclease
MKKGDHIKKMLNDGASYREIIDELHVAKSTIAYHARTLNIAKRVGSERYDWEEIERYLLNGNTTTDARLKYGFTRDSLYEASKRGAIVIPRASSNYRWPMKEILIENSSYQAQNTLKRRLVEAGLLEYKCHNLICPIHLETTWCGEPIVLHLDHINGIRNDNRLENLQFLCPNCHSQTPTYCGRNKNRTGASGENRTLGAEF